MQKDNIETPKRRVKRVHASTPELVNKTTVDNATTSIRPSVSRHRSTMAPSEFALPHGSSRRLALDQSSVFHNQLSSDRHAECNDIELKLLYDEYLQNIMTEIILKKKAEEAEKLFLTQLATITDEIEHNEEKLFKLKTRERDIINLTKLQNDIDSQIADVSKWAKSEDLKQLTDTLSQLHSLLQGSDVLHCNNIILPETSEEWKETIQTIKVCRDTLKSIVNLIETKYNSYQSVNNGIKDFLTSYSDIEDYHERLEKELCKLQALVLKTTSLSIMQNRD